MAEILEFRPAESTRHDEDHFTGNRGPAEVVMFPGVRYERWAEIADAAQEPTSSARVRRRDVIELAE